MEHGSAQQSLTKLAVSATLHCLTGCAIGEVLGMVIGTALGRSDVQTIVLAVAPAFALAVALVGTVPVNRWLIGRGRGHAVVHRFHGSGNGAQH